MSTTCRRCGRPDSSIASGQPGVGVIGAPSGNFIAKAELGQFDSTPPNAPANGGIAALLAPNRIELQWQGVSDDANGIGVYSYWLYRTGREACDPFEEFPDYYCDPYGLTLNVRLVGEICG